MLCTINVVPLCKCNFHPPCFFLALLAITSVIMTNAGTPLLHPEPSSTSFAFPSHELVMLCQLNEIYKSLIGVAANGRID